jgi:hypothetical protein
VSTSSSSLESTLLPFLLRPFFLVEFFFLLAADTNDFDDDGDGVDRFLFVAVLRFGVDVDDDEPFLLLTMVPMVLASASSASFFSSIASAPFINPFIHSIRQTQLRKEDCCGVDSPLAVIGNR